MAKIMVFQHVPYEPLGTLDPLIRSCKHRIKYINFGREQLKQPSIEGYDALIILGGPMNIGEEADYPHLNIEKAAIKKAIELDIPILGICLGAQLIASALGAKVVKAKQSEIGWYSMSPTQIAIDDPLIKCFKNEEKIFQWHQYTFDLPENAKLLVEGTTVKNQAFCINQKIYGFQFHLEANLALIKRWLKLPAHLQELGLEQAPNRVKSIWQDSLLEIDNSLTLSQKVFSQFLALLPKVNEKHILPHKH